MLLWVDFYVPFLVCPVSSRAFVRLVETSWLAPLPQDEDW